MKLLQAALAKAKKSAEAKGTPKAGKDPLVLAMEEYIGADSAADKAEALKGFLELHAQSAPAKEE